MSTALRILTIAPTPARTARRHAERAPRGGLMVRGRFYRGGQFCPAPAPRPALDVTATDGVVTVADPDSGTVEVFRVGPAESAKLAGKRIVSVLIGDDPSDPWAWKGWAFADDFGLSVWSRYAGRPEVAGWVEMLTQSARLAAMGREYHVNPAR